MRVLWFVGFVTLSTVVVMSDLAYGQRGPGPHGGPPCEYRGMPYGHFCPGRGRGPYGIRRPVRTADEARGVVEAYFAAVGEKMSTGKIEERELFFEVEIVNKDGTLIDKVIVDKRTGRIRSIY